MYQLLAYALLYIFSNLLNIKYCLCGNFCIQGRSQLDSSDQMFTHFKAYDDQKGSFGSLVASTASFVKYIGNFKDILTTRTIKNQNYIQVKHLYKTNFVHDDYSFFKFVTLKWENALRISDDLRYTVHFFHNDSATVQVKAMHVTFKWGIKTI